jgi:hypothetical protein
VRQTARWRRTLKSATPFSFIQLENVCVSKGLAPDTVPRYAGLVLDEAHRLGGVNRQ